MAECALEDARQEGYARSSSSSSSKSSEIRFTCTGCVCETSSSDSHSGQLRISPSSTSSSSTSISAEHSGQRITAPSSVEWFTKWRYEVVLHRCAAYYIPWNMKSTPERGAAAWNSTTSYRQGPPAWLLPESTPKDPLSE